MKLATCLVLPAAVLGLAACGSSKPSTPASSSAEVPGMSGQTQRDKAPAAKPAAPAKPRSEARSAKVAPRAGRSSSSDKSSRHAARTKSSGTPVNNLPASARQYPLIVTAKGITPVVMGGDVVPARVPFALLLASADGKSHTVTLSKPVERRINVVPNHPGRISFGGLAPGRYTLRVDGTNLKTTLQATEMSKAGTSAFGGGAAPAK